MYLLNMMSKHLSTLTNKRNINLRGRPPVAAHHFSLPFQPPCQQSPEKPKQQMLALSDQLTASPTLISLGAGLTKLALFLSYHLCPGGPKSVSVYILD
jgi:hypothetical protein